MANLTEKDPSPTNVRVEYWCEVTINTGNFENIKPGIRLAADVPDGVHPSKVRDKLKNLVDNWLEEDLNKYKAELNG